MTIDFRLRPPFQGFLKTLMYSAPGRRNDITAQMQFDPSLAAVEKSMELVLQDMKTAGIDRGVAVGRFAGTLGSVPNADIIDLVNKYPDSFIGAASIDPTNYYKAISEIEQAMAEGLKLVNIEPGAYPAPMYVDDRRLYPIYAYCEQMDIPVTMMLGGTAGPDLSYSSPERTDRMLADFPRLQVVVTHGGWPWVTQILHIAFRRKNLWLSPDMYFSRMPGWRDYVEAANGFLSDRMLYASSFPFCPIVDYKEWFETLPINSDNMEKIMSKNARRLLKL